MAPKYNTRQRMTSPYVSVSDNFVLDISVSKAVATSAPKNATLEGTLLYKFPTTVVEESFEATWDSDEQHYDVVSSSISATISDSEKIKVTYDGEVYTLYNDPSESHLEVGEDDPPDIKGTYEGSSFYVGNVYGVTISLGQNKEVKGKMIFITDGRFVETTLIPDDSSSDFGFNSLPGVWRKRINSLGDVHWDLEFADTMTFHGNSIAATGAVGWMTKGGGRWTITPTLIENDIVIEYDAIYVDDGYNQANNQKPTASYGSWERISSDVTINGGTVTESQDELTEGDEEDENDEVVVESTTCTDTKDAFFLTNVDTEPLDTLSGGYNGSDFVFSASTADSEQEAIVGGTIDINGVGTVEATFSFKSVRYIDGDLYEEHLQILTPVGCLVANALYIDYGVGFTSTAERADFLVHTSYGELRETKGNLIRITFNNVDPCLPRTIALVPSSFGANKVNANLLPTESDSE